MTDTGFELASPEVIAEAFQEGLVVLNLDSGKYFDVGERAAPLLTALSEGVGLQSLKSALEAREPGAGAQVEDAVSRMRSDGLLREVPARKLDVDDTMCSAILSAGDTFHIEGYSDLAELIAADPVHDLHPETGRPIA